MNEKKLDTPTALLLFTFLFLGIGAIYVLFMFRPYYKVGDCFKTENYTYKVKEVGKYSIRADRALYNGFETVVFSDYELKKTIEVDCFDTFNVKDPLKEN